MHGGRDPFIWCSHPENEYGRQPWYSHVIILFYNTGRRDNTTLHNQLLLKTNKACTAQASTGNCQHSFVRSFLPSFIHSHSITRSVIHSLIHPSTHPSIHPCIHSFNPINLDLQIPYHKYSWWIPATARSSNRKNLRNNAQSTRRTYTSSILAIAGVHVTRLGLLVAGRILGLLVSQLTQQPVKPSLHTTSYSIILQYAMHNANAGLCPFVRLSVNLPSSGFVSKGLDIS